MHPKYILILAVAILAILLLVDSECDLSSISVFPDLCLVFAVETLISVHPRQNYTCFTSDVTHMINVYYSAICEHESNR